MYSKREGSTKRRYRFPRSLKVTKLGKWYIAILLLIGITAINTGNNLLYLVVGMLLALIIISGIMSESTLRKVRVKRSLPKEIFAGIPVVASLEILNTKRLFPSYSFVVNESTQDKLVSEPAYVLKLARGEKLTRHPGYTFKRRGKVTLEGQVIETSFPFALFKKGKREDCEEALLVYPRIWPINEDSLPLKSVLPSAGKLRRKGDGYELFALRDYIEGEDARRIDWKSSARTRVLLTREFEMEQDLKLLIEFDNSRHASNTLFEEKVSEAASLAAHFIKRGFSVGLISRDERLKCARGRGHLLKILRVLALIEPSGPLEAAKPPSVMVRPL